MIRLVIITLFLASLLSALSCSKSASRGQLLYEENCASCHLESGEGVGALMPPIKDNDYIPANRNLLACIIKNGMEGEVEVNGVTYSENMKGFDDLSDADIVNILNYIQEAWYPELKSFSIPEIQDHLDQCP